MPDILYAMFLIAMFLTAYVVSTIIHELGHIICGLFHHWKLTMLVIGPIKVYRNTLSSPIKIGFEKNITLWGGAGGTLPQKESDDDIKIWSKILLAGPIASIVSGAIFSLVFFITRARPLLLFIFVPIAMGMVCLIPSNLKTGILGVDGARYKRIKSGGRVQAEEIAIWKLSAQSFRNENDTIYPEEQIQILLSSDDYILKYYGLYFSCQNAMYLKDITTAKKILANMKEIQKNVPKIVLEDCKIKSM